jgi:hypothetical protein
MKTTTKDIDLKISIGISLFGILITCYLWTYVTEGNHWRLFATKTEFFLKKYGSLMRVLFSGILLFPVLFKRDKKRLVTALISIPVFTFLSYSLIIFLD